MKLRKSKKTVRVLSLILAVAMLMSAMMVQAFAAQSASGNAGGCSFSAYISNPSNILYRVEVTSSDRMIHDVVSIGNFKKDINGDIISQRSASSYNGWDITHNHYAPTGHKTNGVCSATITSTYNGMSDDIYVAVVS